MKFVDRDVCIELECELGHGLAHVAVVMDDLVDGETQPKQIVTMFSCGRVHRGIGEAGALENLDELVEKERNPMGTYLVGYAWKPLRADLDLGPLYDVRALRDEEFVEQCSLLSPRADSEDER